MTTSMRIREPQELLALIPYQLGFPPRESVVVVSLRGPSQRVGLVARTDLADLAERVEGRQLSRNLVSHVASDGGRAVVLVVYCDSWDGPRDRSGKTHALRAVASFQEAAAPFLASVDVWVVTSTGYFALDCADELCCPVGGRQLSDLESTRVGAQMVLSGVSVVRSRADLAAVPRADPTGRRRSAAAAARWRKRRTTEPGAVHRWQRESVTAWREAHAQAARGENVAAPVLGRLEAVLEDPRMRDAVLVALVPGTGDLPERLTEEAPSPARRRQTDEAVGRAVAAIVDPRAAVRPDDEICRAAQCVLEGVIGHAATRRQAPALTLLALLTWWRGGGARAGALLERALRCDPSYPLGLLVRQALDAGIPPGWVRTDDALDARD